MKRAAPDCHGLTGKGDGRRPACCECDHGLHIGPLQVRSTESGALPTDADLDKSIKSGMQAPPMPDGPISGDAQIGAVTTYIKAFSPRFRRNAPAD